MGHGEYDQFNSFAMQMRIGQTTRARRRKKETRIIGKRARGRKREEKKRRGRPPLDAVMR